MYQLQMQEFHESWRKLVNAMQWHATNFKQDQQCTIREFATSSAVELLRYQIGTMLYFLTRFVRRFTSFRPMCPRILRTAAIMVGKWRDIKGIAFAYVAGMPRVDVATKSSSGGQDRTGVCSRGTEVR